MTTDSTRWAGDMSTTYEQLLVPPVFHPFAVDLAQRVSAHSPRRVLELAAGTGALTTEIVRTAPDAHVTATDLNAAMVDVGRHRVPEATWQAADATSLPFGEASFDLVACQFGIMFFPDKPAAYAEVRRVLTAGGRFVASTWGVLSSHDFQSAVAAALAEVFPDDPPPFLAAVPHGYTDEGRIVADLRAGGMECLSYDTVTLEGHADSAADLARGYCLGSPVRADIEARGDLEQATEAVAKAMEARFGPGPVSGRMTAHVVDARPARLRFSRASG
jgi:SAM-dependent methyltransferase